MGLRITPTGTKAYILNCRVAGRERRATLQLVSEILLKAARKLGTIREGKSNPLERRRETTRAPTVTDGLARFSREYAPARIERGRISPRTAKDFRQQARRYIVSTLGRRKIREITRRDVEGLVEPLTNVRRNRVLALVSRLFNVFESWEWRPQNTNPAHAIERALEEPRDRTLSPTELAALARALKATETLRPAPLAAIRLAAVTGLRTSEALGIRWEHVDLDSARLILPSTKTGRRVHYLPAVAVDILKARLRMNDRALTSGRNAPITYKTVREASVAASDAAGLVTCG